MSKPRDFLNVHYSQIVLSRNVAHRTEAEMGDMDQLKRSIRASGLLRPLNVKKLDESTYTILPGGGYRRMLAIKELIDDGMENKLKWVPVFIQRDVRPLADALSLLTEEMQVPHGAKTKAQAIRDFLREGFPLAEVACVSGYSLDELRQILAVAGDVPPPSLRTPVALPDEEEEPLSGADRIALLLVSTSDASESDRRVLATRIGALLEYMEGRAPADHVLAALR